MHSRDIPRILLACGNALLLAVFLCGLTHAQFVNVIVDANGPRNPHCKSTGDIDGDGQIDILAASSTDNTEGLFWYRYPDWARYNIHTGSFTTDMQVGDVDGDGDVDAIIPKGRDRGTSLWWYENPRPSGNPAVGPWQEHFIDTVGAHDVEVGDLNGDGRLDIVVREDTTVIFLQIGPDEWIRQAVNTRPTEGTSLGDLDGDGDLDIAINRYWLENPMPGGDPDTADWVEHLFAAGWPDAVATHIADVNQDGRPDILIAPSESALGHLAWYEALDPKTGPWIEHIVDADISYFHKFKTGDMDRDGTLDIVAAEMHQSPSPQRVIVYLNTAGNGLQWTTQIVSTTGSHNIRVGDIGDDGDLDIVGANWSNAAPNGAPIEMWENLLYSPPLSLDRWQRHVIDANRPWRAVFVAPIDIDSDGKKDVVTGAWWYRNPGIPGGLWTRNVIGDSLYNMAAVYDFDGDGTMDVLGTQGQNEPTSSTFVWARNDGAGNFAIHKNVEQAVGSFLQGVAVARFDPGGPLEVALSWHDSPEGTQMLTLPSDPSTGVWSWKSIAAVSQYEQLSAGDIDGDGDSDLLMGTQWLENGDTSWVPLTLDPTAMLPDRNRLVDINKDGRLDAVVGFETSVLPGRLAWYEQPAGGASGLWTEHLITTDIIGAMSVDVADADNDGDVDVVVGEHNLADPASARLLVFENIDSVGLSWTQHHVFTGDEHHAGAQLVDIDNDGDLDIVSIGWTHDDVLLYENLALTTTLEAPSITGQPANRTVLVGQTATFTVTATGTAPLSYQWQKNNVDIPGATGSSYTTPGTVDGDNGSAYCCVVTNAVGSVTSNSATLTVNAAPPPPVVNVLSNGGFESGSTGWNFYTNGSGFTSVVTPGSTGSGQALRVVITAAGTNVQLYQAGLTLQPNTSYQLSFDAYSSSGHDLEVSLNKHTPPYTNYGLAARLFNLSTSWQSYVVTFTTGNFTSAVTDGRLMFWLAPYDAAGDLYTIDNIVLSRAVDLIPEPPVIVQEPVNQTVTEGETATFAVTATGTAPLTYQWQKDGVSIAGASGASYATPVTTPADSGKRFRCVVVNALGSDTSASAMLSVNRAPLLGPSITGQPANRAVLVGQTATFSVTVTGTAPFTYRWQKNNVDIPGATGSSYTTPATVAGDNGSTYRCIVSNAVDSDTSNSATLTVNSAPPPVVNVLSNGGFESGSTGWNFYTNGSGFTSVVAPGSTGSGQALQVVITAAGTNVQLYQAGLTLQPNTSYQLSFDGYSSSGHDLEISLNKHTPPYTNYGLAARLFNLSASWQSYVVTFTTGNFTSGVTDGRLMFWLAPYDAAGDLYTIDNIVLARAADLTPEPPVIVQEPVSQTVTEGETATFAVTATGTAPLTYQWQKDGVGIAGASSASYTTPATTLPDSGKSFRCVVVNALGSDTSASAMLTVTRVPLTGPSITVQPANRTVLVGQTATFSVTATGTAPLSYQWQKNNVDIPGATGSSYTTPATVAGDNGSTYRCVVTNAVGSVTSNSATLTVNSAPPPVVNVLSNGGFESGSTGWNFYTNGSGFTSVVTPGSTGSGQALRVVITAAGTNVQLYQAGLTLQPNTSYQLSFDAYSSSGHDLEISLNKHTPPYTNYGLAARLFNLSTSWQSYVVTFTTGNFTSAVTDGRLMFWLAPYDAAGDLYTIDNIVLARAADLTPEPPVIVQEPVNQTVTEGETATFAVTATGTAPLTYQWQKDGVSIAGASGASYTTSATTPADSGSVYRCIVTNAGGADTTSQAVLVVRRSGGPEVSIWYGTNQAFGQVGTPQRWVNILGNVSDSNGVASLSYTLNGGTPISLLTGPNQRRLARKGDFNIDIASAALQVGENFVTVEATDSAGYASSTAIKIVKTDGRVWPATYVVSWVTPGGLQDSAQIVDGKWGVVPGGIRPIEAGYDRIVSLGDTLWTDYEVLAQITVHAIDSTEQAYDTVSVAPGFGFCLRWTGHTDAPDAGPLHSHPKSGYLPFGAIGRYVWRRGFNNGLESRWELLGNDQVLLDSSAVVSLPYEARYYWKMRVTSTDGQGALYSFKAWPTEEVEPSTWMMRAQGQGSDPQRGSMIIVAHHVDATIGTVMVRPIDTSPPVLSDISVAAGMSTVKITWKTNEPASSRAYCGLTTAYSDSVISAGLVLSHTAEFTGLTPDTVYHFTIVCIDSAGNSEASSDLTFATSSIPLPAFQSDEFDGPDLNTALWTIVDPRSDAVVSIAGAGTAEARLSISVPAGVSHDVWAGNFAPRVIQSAANEDFEVEVKFDAPLIAQYQMQGVLVQQDEGNSLRFDIVRDNAGSRLFAASFIGGAVSVRTDTRIASGAPFYMRVKRVGNDWVQSYAFDGENWVAAPAFNHTLSVSGIGPFAGNHGEPETSSPAWTALVDYFLNISAPGGLAKGGNVELPGDQVAPVPEQFALEGNYPNPFNPATTIRYGLPEQATISMKLYSMLGQELVTLAEGERAAGYHEVGWDGRNAKGGRVGSGLILCRLVATGVSGKTYTDVRRMALVR